LIYQITFANEYAIIMGKVTIGGKGLPGVSVYVKYSKEGSSTNLEGQYQIKVRSGQLVLVASAAGFKSKEVKNRYTVLLSKID